MPKKVHLDSVLKPGGSVWYTLVFENAREFFVEERLDSNRPFARNQVTTINPPDFYKHTVNGTPLPRLVASKLSELGEDRVVERSG